jgi:hypothetical protein
MPLKLRDRMGVDTLEKLEDAARRRYAEARELEGSEPLGAVYLYGYTIEIRLKGACYRLANTNPRHDLAAAAGGGALSPRALAEARIRQLVGAAAPRQVGHFLGGWLTLLHDARATRGLAPLSATVRRTIDRHVLNAQLCWSEQLRYRANAPYDYELRQIAAAARWIKMNYRRLWS